MTHDYSRDIEIRRWCELAASDPLVCQLDDIFFESSATRAFGGEKERAAFRERWLGRYLEHFPEHAYLATTPRGDVAGYLVGSLEDPALMPLFADYPHFQDWRELTARYPAQLHVNVDARFRGGGIGARLVETFAGDAQRAGAPGIHVVTMRGLRNVGFYHAHGFVERGRLPAPAERELIFLGRDLVQSGLRD